MTAPILEVRGLVKRYARGLFRRRETFRLEADLTMHDSSIVGVMGPNGSGKTTLFELITGSNVPSAGSVRVMGRNIHDVKYAERDRLAIHYHQSYQVRHFRRTRPSFLMRPAGHDYPMVHLFDEPQFNTRDGYIGFMLDFFLRLKSEGRLVFVCLHPNEPYHLELMEEVCERFVFVLAGRVRESPDFRSLLREPDVRTYLGRLAPVHAA
ncbi:MAG: ATP-binding cassette domain-containing protein [Paracoccaceae bacterium]|nr:ATP-binding cassette domain-containing protein [Paracoccaceae bacterium]